MNRQVPPAVFYVIVGLVFCVIAVLLYRQATEPIYKRDPNLMPQKFTGPGQRQQMMQQMMRQRGGGAPGGLPQGVDKLMNPPGPPAKSTAPKSKPSGGEAKPTEAKPKGEGP